MKNRKGFTLVELLAVIVILALIMGIAVVSIGSIIQSSREKTYRETAANIINGIRQNLYINNKVLVGDYEFTSTVLERGNTSSPLGGEIHFLSDISGCPVENRIGNNICKVDYQVCQASSTSFVRVMRNNNNYEFSICLTSGADEKYIDTATEEELMGESRDDVIKDSSDAPTYFSPDVPTISGGKTKVSNYQTNTLTCTASTSYGAGTSIYYEFGYATSTVNYTNGTITWLGTKTTTPTLSIAKDAFLGTRYYGCRIYASDGTTQSGVVQSASTTNTSIVNARLYFDAATNGGTIDQSANLYVAYANNAVYTGRTNTTAGTIPIATKSGQTFTGWWTAASGGKKVIDASGTIQASVSKWTNASAQWIRTATGNNNSSNKLYAQFS